MHLDIIRIGNSKGLILPKSILNQCGIHNMINLEVKDRSVIITPYDGPRKNWEESFKAMALEGDDLLLETETTASAWDDNEWQW